MTSSSNFFTTHRITDQVRAQVAKLQDKDISEAEPDELPDLARTALALLRAMLANPSNNVGDVTPLLEKIYYLRTVSPDSFKGVDTLLSAGESLARLGR